MARDRLHPAWLLHRRPWSNTSLLIECFTAEQGRFPALAKGAMTRRRGGQVLQPFQALLISSSGRGEVRTLTASEAQSPALPLVGRALYCGFYLNELVMRLLQRSDPHPVLFEAYSQALQRLAREPDTERLLRDFELRLLTEIGYGPQFDQLADGTPVGADDRCYQYRLEEGLVPVAADHAEAVSGRALRALAEGGELDAPGRRQVRWLMRRILAHYLGGRELKSRELFRARGGSRAV